MKDEMSRIKRELTPAQLVEFAAQQDVPLTENALALLRRDGAGPPYIKRGRWVTYRRRDAIRFIESRKPRLIFPETRKAS